MCAPTGSRRSVTASVHGDREPGAEAVAGLHDRRGAAAERVDRRGHRLDRREVAARGHVELRERIRRAEAELDARGRAPAARSGGRRRARSGRRTCGRRAARVRRAAATRSPVGMHALVDEHALARRPAQLPFAARHAGELDERVPAERDGTARRPVGSISVVRRRPRSSSRASIVTTCGNGNAREQVGPRAVVEAGDEPGAARAGLGQDDLERRAAQVAVHGQAVGVGREVDAARGRPCAGRRGSARRSRRLPHGCTSGTAVMRPSRNCASVRGHATNSSPRCRSDAHSIPHSGQERRVVLARDAA